MGNKNRRPIYGALGSGKSFAAKREMVNVFLNTDNKILVINPEAEYEHITQLNRKMPVTPTVTLYSIDGGKQ